MSEDTGTEVTAEDVPEDDSIGQRIDAAVSALRQEVSSLIDNVQAKVDELSAKVDAAQGQSQAQ